jgi:hypothetical protein
MRFKDITVRVVRRRRDSWLERIIYLTSSKLMPRV